MGFILQTADGRTLKVNAWNWGALHEAVSAARVFPEEEWAGARFNGSFQLPAPGVTALADFLERRLLPALSPGERLLLDGSKTDVPDDGTFHRADADLWRNYSLDRGVLVAVVAFLRSAGGPVAIG